MPLALPVPRHEFALVVTHWRSQWHPSESLQQMSSPVICVDQVSKRFQLGTRFSYLRLSETIEGLARSVLTSPTKRRAATDEEAQRTHLWALREVSFDIPQGQMLGIIGRNGAGKSTLLKILARITRPTEGRVGVAGRVGSLLEVGTGFHPELTGRENIFLNGAVLGMTRREIERKLDEIVAFAELSAFLDTPVKRYSSGMYMRLAFAVAAHLEPDILLVDEVLAVGDAGFRKKCLSKMGEVRRSGRTVILVSHNMPTVMAECERVLFLNAGRLVADGSPAEVVREYLALMSGTGDGTVVWDDVTTAPGNDVLRLRAVRVLQEASETPSGDTDIALPTHIAVEYEVLRPETRCFCSIWLKTASQTHVLSTFNSPSASLSPDEWYDRPHPVGRYRAVCTLPANFLNDETYEISAFVGRTVGQADAVAEGILSFEVHDSGAMRGEYSGSWAGPVIRPRLAWQTTPLEGAGASYTG